MYGQQQYFYPQAPHGMPMPMAPMYGAPMVGGPMGPMGSSFQAGGYPYYAGPMAPGQLTYTHSIPMGSHVSAAAAPASAYTGTVAGPSSAGGPERVRAAGTGQHTDDDEVADQYGPRKILSRIPSVMLDRVPDGLEVRPNTYGMALFATRAFKCGETLYTGHFLDVPDVLGHSTLITQTGEYKLDTDTHAVFFTEARGGRRMFYGFDSFMNHSCEPSTYSELDDGYAERQDYRTVALRDIAPGDEITCDYLLFDWDCAEKSIAKCLCGSAGCVGAVLGFKFLAHEHQACRLARADEYLFELFKVEQGAKLMVLGDCSPAPETVELSSKRSGDGKTVRTLRAAKAFAAGEVVSRSAVMTVAKHVRVVMIVNGERMFAPPVAAGAPDVDAFAIGDWAAFVPTAAAGTAPNVVRAPIGASGVVELHATKAIAAGELLFL